MLKNTGTANGFSIKVGIAFAKLGLSPNMWTLISILPAFGGLIALCYGKLLIGAAFFILAGAMDMIDGAVARATGRATNFGAFLDGVVDRYIEILLYMGILIYTYVTLVPTEILGIPNSIWVALLIFGAFMTTFVKAYADHKSVITDEKKLKAMGGFIERAERLILVYAAMILGYFDPAFLVYILALTAVLTNLTAIQRIIYATRHADTSI